MVVKKPIQPVADVEKNHFMFRNEFARLVVLEKQRNCDIIIGQNRINRFNHPLNLFYKS
jgi:hypothetical protein